MGPSFPSDPEAPTGVRFQCSACGIAFCRRVLVSRKDGQNYETEFVSCEGCLLIYHWPGEVPRHAAIDPRQSAGGYRAEVPSDWKPTNGMTEEDLVRIREAAARANKSKGKRSRR